MTPTDEQVEAGQVVYTRRLLRAEDDLDGLWEALRQRFDRVSVEVIGSVALFSGRT